MDTLQLILFLTCFLSLTTLSNCANDTNCPSVNGHGQSSGGHESKPLERFPILQLLWHHVQGIYIITCWLLAACVLKIGKFITFFNNWITFILFLAFHLTPWLSNHVPESAALITLGIVLGLILKFSGVGAEHYKLDTYTFFYFMLPPIVFDSGFHMPNRAFFGNIGTILLFAVIGTVFNATTIGLTIWGICQATSCMLLFNLDYFCD